MARYDFILQCGETHESQYVYRVPNEHIKTIVITV